MDSARNQWTPPAIAIRNLGVCVSYVAHVAERAVTPSVDVHVFLSFSLSISLSPLRLSRPLRAVCHNVMKQLMSKNGSFPWTVSFDHLARRPGLADVLPTLQRVLVIGIDVYHPRRQRRGVCASSCACVR